MLKQDFAKYVGLIGKPTHVCRKCGRAANREKLLCEPRYLNTGHPDD